MPLPVASIAPTICDPLAKAGCPVAETTIGQSSTPLVGSSGFATTALPIEVTSSIFFSSTAVQGTPSQETPAPSSSTLLQTAAQVSATPLPSSSVSAKSSSKGLSNGAVAGIAIGTAIAGAAIASLLAFLFFKRRNRTRGDYQPASQISYLPKEDPSALSMATVPAPLPALAPAHAPAAPSANRDFDLTNLAESSDLLAAILPRASDTHTVCERVVGLFEQIQRHVESFYRDAHATFTPSMEEELSRFGDGSLPEALADMLRGASKPTVLILHCLIFFVLDITSGKGEGVVRSLLPGAVLNAMGARRGDPSAASILSKQLAVHLSGSRPVNPSAIREAAEHFSLTFFPWANPTFSDGADEELAQIIAGALELNIWLLGQPFVYEYDWSSGMGRGGVVFKPGLRRMTDERGEMLGRPSTLLEPVVVGM